MGKTPKKNPDGYPGLLGEHWRPPKFPSRFRGTVTPQQLEEFARVYRSALRQHMFEDPLKERVDALFKYFKLQRDDWQSLALRLAAQHVPGFQIQRTMAIEKLGDHDVPGFRIVGKIRGAKKDWGSKKLARLLADRNDRPERKDRAALKELRKKDEWKDYELSTLESRLRDAKIQARLAARGL